MGGQRRKDVQASEGIPRPPKGYFRIVFITRIARFDSGTGGQLGAVEMILSSAISGVAYALFSG